MRFAHRLSARFALPLSLGLGLGAASFTGCVNEVSGPSNIALDDVHGAIEGAIDGDADVDLVQSGPWEVVVLSGDAANDLYAAMDDAGGFAPESKNGLSYLYGRYILCVTNGAASACHLYTRGTNSQEGYSVTFFGNRFDSAAGELFGTVARAQGIAPQDVTQISIGRFDCIKGSTDAGCGVRQPESDAPTMGDDLRPLTVDLNGLEPLGAGFVYEGWLIVDGAPVPAGRFNLDGNRSVTFDLDADDVENATMYVLTIEPAEGDDPAPSDTHVIAGAFNGATADLDVAHPAALGSDFVDARGDFILGAPTSNLPNTQNFGIWFVNPQTGAPSLDLPELPAGWAYEGWVVGDNGPISTGRFTDVGSADSDGAGPTAGPNGAPDFPGQDFINPLMNLEGVTVVISIEPQPDDSAAPFTYKPLVGQETLGDDHVLQGLGQNLGSLATGTARR